MGKLDAAVGITAIAPEVDAEDTRIGVAGEVALDIVDQAGLLAQSKVEPTVHAWTSQHIIEHIESGAAGIACRVSHATYHHVCLMRAAREGHLTGYVGWWGHAAFVEAARGDVGGEALGPHQDAREGYIAIDEEDGVGRTVVATSEAEAALSGEAAQRAGIAQDIMTQGMVGKEGALEVIEDELGGVVAVAVNLLEYDAALLVNLVLGKGAVEDDVGEQLEGTRKVLLQECRVHHRLLLIGIGIEVATHILHAVQDVPGTALCRTLEEHMLHEMSETCLVGLLLARTCIDGVATVGYLGGRRCVYDAQTIGQRGGVIGLMFHNFLDKDCKSTTFPNITQMGYDTKIYVKPTTFFHHISFIVCQLCKFNQKEE